MLAERARAGSRDEEMPGNGVGGSAGPSRQSSTLAAFRLWRWTEPGAPGRKLLWEGIGINGAARGLQHLLPRGGLRLSWVRLELSRSARP